MALLEVKVWGDFACFTRPETKVERVSYPVMTPSAARGVLEAIFWKPEFVWLVREIWILKPIQYFSILRNEINNKQSYRSKGVYFADDSNNRAQRHTLALRDVAYIIKARIELKSHADADIAKYQDQFRRRVERGQCAHRPYLGCREFSAEFSPVDGSEHPISLTDNLGQMLGDLDYEADGSGKPIFFEAELDNGILKVPESIYKRQEVIADDLG